MNTTTRRVGAVGSALVVLSIGAAACGHSYNNACASTISVQGLQYVAASSGGYRSSSGSSSRSYSGGSGSKTTSNSGGSTRTSTGSRSSSSSSGSSSKSTTKTTVGGSKVSLSKSGVVSSVSSRHSAAIRGSIPTAGGYRATSSYRAPRGSIVEPWSGGVAIPPGRPSPFYPHPGYWSFAGYPGVYPVGVYPPYFLGSSC